jgi:glycosyltransferase involved in cell wall biosynthesis
MNISYVSTYDAQNILNWSGLGYNIAKALENQDNKLDYITVDYKFNLAQRLRSKFYNRILGRVLDLQRTPKRSKQFAHQISTKIKPDSELIFSPGTLPLSLLESKIPTVSYTDSTFAGLLGFYNDFENLSQETIKHGNYLEQQALNSITLAIYSSDWAAKTAIDNYHVDPSKVKVVPFGANIVSTRSLKDIETIVAGRDEKECHLLFIGVEWKRKGCDLAIEVAEALNRMGIKTTLHIVGIKQIPVTTLPEFVINYGFLSKNTPEGNLQLEKLFIKSHFLIVPSIAEAYGLVFCEANSFGMPSIARNVGGIPTIIKNDLNGQLFDLDINAQAYANYIQSMFTNKQQYSELARSSFNEYETRLNWKVAGAALNRLLKEL